MAKLGEIKSDSDLTTVGGNPPTWGAITGTLSNQSDLNTALTGKAAATHAHAPADVTGTAVVTNDARLSDARTPLTHMHTEANVTNLTTDLAGKAASVHSHAPGDVTGTAVVTSDARLSDARMPLTHAHAEVDVTNLITDLAGKAATSHTHIEANVTNLVTDLAAKAAVTHIHVEADTTNLVTDLAGKAASVHTHTYERVVYAVLSNGATAMAFGTNSSVKVTPTATASFTTTVPPAGSRCTLMILTSGTVSYTITFGTGFKSTGTLATGTTTAKIFMVNFVSDGTNLYEAGRTAAMAA